MSDAENKHKARLLQGIKYYAEADKSDPFTAQRCKTHMQRGMCKAIDAKCEMTWVDHDGKLVPLTADVGAAGHYDADPAQEKRLTPTGESYLVTVYRNVCRP